MPEEVRDRLLEAHRSYVSAKSRGLSREFSRQLAAQLMTILGEITLLRSVSARHC